MPSITIYIDDTDDQGFTPNGYEVGHAYIKLEGGGLNEGVFSQFNHDGDSDIFVGFYSDSGVHNDEARLNNALSDPTIGLIQKTIELTDEQFEAVKTAFTNFVNTNQDYDVGAHNCVDFVQQIYSATGFGGNFTQFPEFSQQNLESLTGGAAYYASGKYGTGNYSTINLLTGFSDLIIHLGTTIEAIQNEATNVYLTTRSFFDDVTGETSTFIKNGIDTFTDPVTSQEYIIFVGEADNDEIFIGTSNQELIIAGNGNDTIKLVLSDNIIDGGEGIDTLSYENITTGDFVNVDLGAGNTYLNLPDDDVPSGQPKDTFTNIENVTGSKNDDIIFGNDLNNTISGGDGDDVIDGGAGADRLTGGSGLDEYHYSGGGFGRDVIIDDDGGIVIDGALLSGKAELMDTAGSFALRSGGINYALKLTGGDLQIIATSDAQNTITIRNYTNGKFGITLGDEEAPDENTPPPIPVITPSLDSQNGFVDDVLNLFEDAGVGLSLIGNIDPLVFDLDGDGVELVGFRESDALFDIDNDAAAEDVGWLSPDDGFLALDRNGNGTVFSTHANDNNGTLLAAWEQRVAA